MKKSKSKRKPKRFYAGHTAPIGEFNDGDWVYIDDKLARIMFIVSGTPFVRWYSPTGCSDPVEIPENRIATYTDRPEWYGKLRSK